MMIGICFFSALASGIAMPLMFLVFGKMVGDFTAYFNNTAPFVIGGFTFKPDVITKEQFVNRVNQNAYVNSIPLDVVYLSEIPTYCIRLYMTYLGIARFLLSYVAMACPLFCFIKNRS
jgi:hypothetical protein